jgi:hypothetical protein
MVLTIAEIRNQQFIEALRKLGALPLPAKVAYKASRICSMVDTEQRAAQKAFEQMVRRLGEVSDDGSFKIKDENKDSWVKEMTDFMKTEINIPWEKINIDSIPDSVMISAEDLMNLEPILFGLESLEGGKDEKDSKKDEEKSSKESL